MSRYPIPLFVLVILVALTGVVRSDDRVLVQATPNGGIRPLAAVDGRGVVHVVYNWKANPAERGPWDNLQYVRKGPEQREFSTPITVNSIPRSVFGTTPADLAVGRDGRVHVAWAASMFYVVDQAKRRPAKMEDMKYLFYTRLAEDGTRFEEQRNVAGDSFGFEMAPAIAADSRGNVHLFWGGSTVDRPHEDAHRRIFGVHSTDGGKSFSSVAPVWDEATGVCVCCTMKAMADPAGTLYLTYRAAEKNENRDTYLLTSKDGGKSFTGALIDRWEINACPTSTYALLPRAEGILFGWENKGEVYFAPSAAATPHRPAAAPAEAGGDARRKFPALAVNRRGETLFAWTEGAHYRKGGDLVWQIFDRSGKPVGEQGRAKEVVRAAGMPAAYAEASGRFVILY